jgi:hypothetical protein
MSNQYWGLIKSNVHARHLENGGTAPLIPNLYEELASHSGRIWVDSGTGLDIL